MRLTRKKLRNLIRETFWREQQARVRQEQLPLDIQAAKHIMLGAMREERPGHLGNVWSLPELIAIVSDVKGKNMKLAVKIALKSLVEEDRVRWEGGGPAGKWYFINRDMI